MTILRHTTVLALASLLVLCVVGSGFAACIQGATSDCCADSHECGDPVCAVGAVCHCSCAHTGILPPVVGLKALAVACGEVDSERVSAFVPQVSRDLFRPPRFV